MKIDSIGFIRTPFKEKFGTPRQGILDVTGQCQIEMGSQYSHPSFFKGLEEFSHLWIYYYLDKSIWKNQTTLRPPRLGGIKRMGLFATRGPHRPNPIGQCLVELERIEFTNSKAILHTSLIDAIDETPLLDIKPYISNYDYAEKTKSGWVNKAEFPSLNVEFSQRAISSLKDHFSNPDRYQRVLRLISTILQQDPRPAYHKSKNLSHLYGIKIYDFDLRFSYQNEQIFVESIE